MLGGVLNEEHMRTAVRCCSQVFTAQMPLMISNQLYQSTAVIVLAVKFSKIDNALDHTENLEKNT